jgi:hypothetical protein
LAILARQIYHKKIARKALNKKTNKSGGAGGQTQLRSRARQPDPSIADGLTPTCGRSGAQTDGLADSARQSTHGQRRQRPHKERKETQGKSTHGRLVKVDPTFDQLLSKYTSKKVVLCDRPTKKPGHLLKQNGPKGDATSIAYSSCDARMLYMCLLIVDILSCSNMECYDDEPMVCAYSLCLFRLGAPPLYSF